MAELNGVPADRDRMTALALTNYGHFTTMRVDGGRVRGLALHLDRLARDCRALFGTELDLERVRALARRAVPASGDPVTVRVTVFDPGLDLGRPASAADPHVLVTSRPAGGEELPPLRVRSARYVRDIPHVKSIGLFANLYHRRQAQLDGYDDALFVAADGLISEGVTWNIGFHDGDRVVWPEAACLPGVTRELLRAAHDHETAPIRLAEVPGMRAAFATNAAVGVRAVSAVDGTRLPDAHPVVDALREAYAGIPGDVL
ncbi:aminotransferase class IV family protein [Streptomyces sp. NPDC058374]|uniref:aminotransferase class IV family protein n=1 Tax=unclassified Streptomyces TaxID=2593676 RepID=UPI00365DB01A